MTGSYADSFLRVAASLVSPAQGLGPVGPDDPVEEGSLVLWNPVSGATSTLSGFLSSDPLDWGALSPRQRGALSRIDRETRIYYDNKWASYLLKLRVSRSFVFPNICTILNSKEALADVMGVYVPSGINICNEESVQIVAGGELPYQIAVERAVKDCLSKIELSSEARAVLTALSEKDAKELICASLALVVHIGVLKSSQTCSSLLKELMLLSGPAGFQAWGFSDFERPINALLKTAGSSLGGIPFVSSLSSTRSAVPSRTTLTATPWEQGGGSEASMLAERYIVAFAAKAYQMLKSLLL